MLISNLVLDHSLDFGELMTQEWGKISERT